MHYANSLLCLSKVIQNSTYKTIIKEILSFSILVPILVVKLSLLMKPFCWCRYVKGLKDSSVYLGKRRPEFGKYSHERIFFSIS